MLHILSLMTIALITNNLELVEAQPSTDKNYATIFSDQSKQSSASTSTPSSKPDTKSDIITLSDGIKYKIVKEGAGESPTENDFIHANYTISFMDGKILSSSMRKNAPPLLEVSALTQGLRKAVMHMKPGSHWIIYIPAELAYGSKGYKNFIPPNSPLIFDLELLNIKNPPNEEVTSVIEEFDEKD